jgi:hypothetical protein
MGLRLYGSQPHGIDGETPGASVNHPPPSRPHTDTVAAVFTCTHCDAEPEQVVDGKATIAIVRHKLGCPTLLAQTPAHAGSPRCAERRGDRPARPVRVRRFD